MYPSMITSALLSLLIAAPTLAHEGHHTGDVTEVPTDSAIAQNISTSHPLASYSPKTGQVVAPTYSDDMASMSSEGVHGDSTNFPYLTTTWTDAATELPQTTAPGPFTQTASAPAYAAYGYEGEDLVLTETDMESVLTTAPPYPEATSFSLPVFTYDDGVQTSVTGGAGSTYETITLINSSLPKSTLVGSTIPAYTNRTANTTTNRTANTTTSRIETLPTAVPNSAGSVTPFLSPIAAVLIVWFLAMGV